MHYNFPHQNIRCARMSCLCTRRNDVWQAIWINFQNYIALWLSRARAWKFNETISFFHSAFIWISKHVERWNMLLAFNWNSNFVGASCSFIKSLLMGKCNFLREAHFWNVITTRHQRLNQDHLFLCSLAPKKLPKLKKFGSWEREGVRRSCRRMQISFIT